MCDEISDERNNSWVRIIPSSSQASITTLSAAEAVGVIIYATPLPERQECSELIETSPSLSNHSFFSAWLIIQGLPHSAFHVAQSSFLLMVPGPYWLMALEISPLFTLVLNFSESIHSPYLLQGMCSVFETAVLCFNVSNLVLRVRLNVYFTAVVAMKRSVSTHSGKSLILVKSLLNNDTIISPV